MAVTVTVLSGVTAVLCSRPDRLLSGGLSAFQGSPPLPEKLDPLLRIHQIEQGFIKRDRLEIATDKCVEAINIIALIHVLAQRWHALGGKRCRPSCESRKSMNSLPALGCGASLSRPVTREKAGV